MNAIKCLRYFTSDIKYFRPITPLTFDSDGRLLLFTTPSATTFLRYYAPINVGFILVHSYLSITEYLYPIIPGRSGYLIMTSSLLAFGIGVAITVEHFSRRFVKNIYLLSDGKHLVFEFHSAFTSASDLKVDIAKCAGLDEVFQNNFRMNISDTRKIYLNLERNEVKDDKINLVLQKVISGFYINTIGDKNLNKILRNY